MQNVSMTVTARLDLASFDAAHIDTVGSFYVELTGWDVLRKDADRFGVRAGQEHPQQFHLDLQVDDPRAAATRAVALGASHLADGPSWVTLADPAGHPFCLLR